MILWELRVYSPLLIAKYAQMALIHHIVSAGSPKESAGRATLSSVIWAMGVV